MQLTFLRIETAIPSKMHQSTLMQKDCRDHPQRSLYMLCSDNPCAFKGELQVIFHINYEHTIKKTEQWQFASNIQPSIPSA
jgi:hypothetical protein